MTDTKNRVRTYRLSMWESDAWARGAICETTRRGARAAYPSATTIEIVAYDGKILETLTFAVSVRP